MLFRRHRDEALVFRNMLVMFEDGSRNSFLSTNRTNYYTYELELWRIPGIGAIPELRSADYIFD